MIHIKKKFGVEYSIKTIYVLLRRLGYKLVKPRPRDIRRNEDDVKKFLTETMPELIKKAADRTVWWKSNDNISG